MKRRTHRLQDPVRGLRRTRPRSTSEPTAADPADKADLYKELGVTLRYDPSGTITVQAQPRGVSVRVGGASRTLTPPSAAAGFFPTA